MLLRGKPSPDGSSPLARGTHLEVPFSGGADRFIPARAGNTVRPSQPVGTPPVHPRSRGEHGHALRRRCGPAGSSPLARGTRIGGPVDVGRIRFIPARAGNTERTAKRHWLRPVHPRSRGEHDQGLMMRSSPHGSSPLARGTRPWCARRRPADRFIPARAGNTGRPSSRAAPTPVHPRSRGEHEYAGDVGLSACGSSPLARGTQRIRVGRRCKRRFIPARAGNTKSEMMPLCVFAVHPRSRGEHAGTIHSPPSKAGSSPLARGTLLRPRSLRRRPRFIPARAGNTCDRSAPAGTSSVHPRSRGEHAGGVGAGINCAGSSPLARGTLAFVLWRESRPRFIPARAGNTSCSLKRKQSASGSSPLARGTLRQPLLVAAVLRFIPARAGNTTLGAVVTGWNAVHPRSRGEHPVLRGVVHHLDGSSPLARGTRDAGILQTAVLRFIPARAGNTRPPLGPCRGTAVHPRSRGEHPSARRSGIAGPGSSPLARGTQRCGRPHRPTGRFIPARAGNTDRRAGPRVPRTVHPRSRGEHARRAGPQLGQAGSSPLARGTPGHRHPRRGHGRFIPARAGNTAERRHKRRVHSVHPRSRGEH